MGSHTFWASQPYTFRGTCNGATGATLNSLLLSADLTRSVEQFYTRCNNSKYEEDGGVISYTNELSLQTYDMNQAGAKLAPGAYWRNVVITWQSEGATSGDPMTATISAFRVDSSNPTDQNGRLALNVRARVLSHSGTAVPVTLAIT